MIIRLLFILFFILSSTLSEAQPPQSYPSSEIFQKIKKLNVLGTVLYVAAHPDDENTRLIAWLSNEKLYRTGYLSMTRGDGGQNLIGDEQGIALGLIRTQELLAARRIDGGEQFFTRAFDFGYSKNPEETFKFWNKEKILADVVWIIRKFRPDVIITRFPTTGEGGHGHHTASAILAGEAFEAAGDSTRFPEQLKMGVSTWKPHRLLWNTFNFGSANTIRNDQFKIDAGGFNTLLGKSYGEIAAESRSEHKSQGFGVSASRGVQYEYFVNIKGDIPEEHLFDGIDVSWNRTGHGNVASLINEIEKDFSFEHPEKSVPALLNLYKTIRDLPGSEWRNQKLKEVRELLLECSALFMEAFSDRQFHIRGKELPFSFSATNRSGVPARVAGISFMNKKLFDGLLLENKNTFNKKLSIKLPLSVPVSQPYWLQEPMSKGAFVINDQQLVGKPENDPLYVDVVVDFDGLKVPYALPLKYKANDPVKGEVYQPLFIIPGAEVVSTPEIAVSQNRRPAEINTRLIINDTSVSISGVNAIHHSDVVEAPGTDNKFYIDKKNQTEIISFSAKDGSETFDRYRVTISYPHIPDIVYFPESKTKLVGVDLKTSGKLAGYIPGAGDKIPEALTQLGYSVEILDRDKITADNLKKFDVIITGVRAYNIHEWLNDVHDDLMNYVNRGGVLFVQYNTNNNLGPVKARIGPYPFDISRTRVTDETAEVSFVKKNNTLLKYPNLITKDDFAGWIQERSTYHASNFKDHYDSLFSMGDPEESSDEGSLIYCNYGKGRFIYSGLVFFRQLPDGNPGAYRLFSNLIAKPKR